MTCLYDEKMQLEEKFSNLLKRTYNVCLIVYFKHKFSTGGWTVFWRLFMELRTKWVTITGWPQKTGNLWSLRKFLICWMWAVPIFMFSCYLPNLDGFIVHFLPLRDKWTDNFRYTFSRISVFSFVFALLGTHQDSRHGTPCDQKWSQ